MYQFRVIHNDQRYLEHVSYLYQDLFIEWVHNKKIPRVNFYSFTCGYKDHFKNHYVSV